MNSILGFAQIMAMDAPGEKQAQRLTHIITAGERLLGLIDELLGLASARTQQAAPQAARQKEDHYDDDHNTGETASYG
jgi:signal transduction histidine kinase